MLLDGFGGASNRALIASLASGKIHYRYWAATTQRHARRHLSRSEDGRSSDLETEMRYQTKLLITAGLLLALSLSAAALAYWGVSQSHAYLSRSRVAHQELERQLQLSRHSQQLFKSWTDTLLTGISDRPLGAAYLHKVIESDLAELDRLTQEEIAMIPDSERRIESAEVERLNAIKKEYQNAVAQLEDVEQLRSRGRPDDAWSTLLALLKGGIDKKLNELIEVAVADETAEVDRSMPMRRGF